MNLALDIYHRMPSLARTIVASTRGYYLNWWRYDSQTEALVEQALDRERWSSDKWEAYREERLAHLLERAATNVPFYREMWAATRRKGDRRSWSYLENWPVLEKESVRRDAAAFVADDRSRSKMFHDHTSGTTGSSLSIWLCASTVRVWYALNEARCRRWFGLDRNDRWAMIGGQLIVRQSQVKPPFWVWNAGMRQLYMSAYHISPSFARHYGEAMVRHRVRYLLGYPAAIYSLAYELTRQNLRRPKLEVVVTNAEPLYQFQRDVISEAFSCPVRETYGMAEIAAAASECSHGSLHQWPEAGIIETDPAMGKVGEAGDLICTGLLNQDMPLIRYRVGDMGRLSSETCGCGRSLPLLAPIEGRRDDVLYTTDGRRVGRMDPVFKSDIPIVEAQIVQRSLSSILVRYVPDRIFNISDRTEIADRIRSRIGDVSVEFEELESIPRTKRGKFKAVVCEIPQTDLPLT